MNLLNDQSSTELEEELEYSSHHSRVCICTVSAAIVSLALNFSVIFINTNTFYQKAGANSSKYTLEEINASLLEELEEKELELEQVKKELELVASNAGTGSSNQQETERIVTLAKKVNKHILLFLLSCEFRQSNEAMI